MSDVSREAQRAKELVALLRELHKDCSGCPVEDLCDVSARLLALVEQQEKALRKIESYVAAIGPDDRWRSDHLHVWELARAALSGGSDV